MAYMPRDVLIEILQRLPHKSLFRLKGVCKSWRQTIDSPQFARVQLNYSAETGNTKEKILLQSFNRDEEKGLNYRYYSVEANPSTAAIETIRPSLEQLCTKPCSSMCSSDGLILVTFSDGTVYLWNPISGKFRIIPNPNPSLHGAIVFGFGYDSSIQDYKILRTSTKLSVNEGRVFELKKNSWRRIESPIHFGIEPQNAVFFKGAIHLIAWTWDPTDEGYLTLSFSLAAETFTIIPTPFLNKCRVASKELSVLEGRLCLQFAFGSDIDDRLFEMWRMNDYGSSNSWSKTITISLTRLCDILVKPLAKILVVRKGVVRVLVIGWNKEQVFVDELDVNNTVRRLANLNGYCTGAVRYEESLISPLYEETPN